jgi:hypothetical protein
VSPAVVETVQPLMSTLFTLGLKSSIYSFPASVPAGFCSISLIIILSMAVEVGVTVEVGVGDTVGVGEGVGETVGVGVG